jgi:hypothetical protein
VQDVCRLVSLALICRATVILDNASRVEPKECS